MFLAVVRRLGSVLSGRKKRCNMKISPVTAGSLLVFRARRLQFSPRALRLGLARSMLVARLRMQRDTEIRCRCQNNTGVDRFDRFELSFALRPTGTPIEHSEKPIPPLTTENPVDRYWPSDWPPEFSRQESVESPPPANIELNVGKWLDLWF
jgi:hypothetical protein